MKQYRRGSSLLNHLANKIDAMGDWFFDLTNDYHHEEQIRKTVRLTVALALIFTLFSDKEPDPYHFSDADINSHDFDATSFQTICVPKDEGHQALISLTKSFSKSYAINRGNNSLVFDSETGLWGMFSLDQGELCLVFSGVNFSQSEPTYMQDALLSRWLGDDYLDNVKPATNHLITSDPAI